MAMRLPVPRASDVDDPAVVARIRAGDERAFEDVVRGLGPGLAAFAVHLVQSHAVAEELVQDVFLRVWSARDRLVVRDTLKTYLYRAVRNRALNGARSRRVIAAWERTETVRLGHRDDLAEGERLVQRSQLAVAVQRAVAALPARCREAFVLVRERGLSYAEAASVMGVSTKTVDVQIGRAVKALRESLRGVWP